MKRRKKKKENRNEPRITLPFISFRALFSCNTTIISLISWSPVLPSPSHSPVFDSMWFDPEWKRCENAIRISRLTRGEMKTIEEKNDWLLNGKKKRKEKEELPSRIPDFNGEMTFFVVDVIDVTPFEHLRERRRELKGERKKDNESEGRNYCDCQLRRRINDIIH